MDVSRREILVNIFSELCDGLQNKAPRRHLRQLEGHVTVLPRQAGRCRVFVRTIWTMQLLSVFAEIETRVEDPFIALTDG